MNKDNGMVTIEVSQNTYSRIQEDKEILSNGKHITDDFVISEAYSRLDSYME